MTNFWKFLKHKFFAYLHLVSFVLIFMLWTDKLSVKHYFIVEIKLFSQKYNSNNRFFYLNCFNIIESESSREKIFLEICGNCAFRHNCTGFILNSTCRLLISINVRYDWRSISPYQESAVSLRHNFPSDRDWTGGKHSRTRRHSTELITDAAEPS